MIKIEIIVQTNSFKKAVKKLHANQKNELYSAIRKIQNDPLIGEQKRGDLSSVRVFKFKMINQLTLIAYSYELDSITLELLTFGPHENFYRDLKNQR